MKLNEKLTINTCFVAGYIEADLFNGGGRSEIIQRITQNNNSNRNNHTFRASAKP